MNIPEKFDPKDSNFPSFVTTTEWDSPRSQLNISKVSSAVTLAGFRLFSMML